MLDPLPGTGGVPKPVDMVVWPRGDWLKEAIRLFWLRRVLLQS